MSFTDDEVNAIGKPARDLAALVAAFRAGAATGVPAAATLELSRAMDTIDENEAYAGELLGVAITFIASAHARAFLAQFGLHLGDDSGPDSGPCTPTV